MPLQMKASLLQYPKFTGSLTAAAAPVFVPRQIISIFFAIVFEKEAVYLHSELGINLSKICCYAGYWELA